MAEVLARRGTRAKLFRGEDGLDELTTTGISTVFDVATGRCARPISTRRTSGWRGRAWSDLAGGDAGGLGADRPRDPRRRRGPRRDVVLLNAAAALEVAARAARSPRACSMAADAIDSGAAAPLSSAGSAVSQNG